jgi:hypothetical protein
MLFAASDHAPARELRAATGLADWRPALLTVTIWLPPRQAVTDLAEDGTRRAADALAQF